MKKYFLFFMIMVFTTGLVFSQVDLKATQTVNVKGRKVSVSTLMTTFADKYGINFVIPQKLDALLTVSLKNVSINAAIKAISKSVNLEVKKIGSIYYFSKPTSFVHPMKNFHGKHGWKSFRGKKGCDGKKSCDGKKENCKCKDKKAGCKGKKERCGSKSKMSGCAGKDSKCNLKKKSCACRKSSKYSKKVKKMVLRTVDNNKNYRDQRLIYTSTPMTEYVSIDVKAFDVKKLFSMIEKMSGKKISVNPRVNGYIDYNVKGKYYKDAVKEIAELANARVIDKETSLTVIK